MSQKAEFLKQFSLTILFQFCPFFWVRIRVRAGVRVKTGVRVKFRVRVKAKVRVGSGLGLG